MTLPEGVERREIQGEVGLATEGEPVYGEPTAAGWRRWNPHRSKLGAMLALDFEMGMEAEDCTLYLGAATGTTVSHVADFAGPTYAVEFAPRPMRDLVSVAEARPNLFPLLADARRPETYGHVVESDLDLLIQDVATTEQARVANRNARFLAADGTVLLAIKARSEDVTRDPAVVFEESLSTLETTYEILETAELDPYHTAHLGVVATPR
ncbi:MAG: fibrillarin-like rRNA/tRNA 2'-O-methyltransferase [Halodesulfurarchaeum sp.]